MENQPTNNIRIHPKGTGCITDQVASKNLQSLTPQAFRKAQDLVVATAKYIKKSGLFSTEKSRILKMQSEFYLLRNALKEDKFMETESNEKDDALIVTAYLSLFSDAFPNWQQEYETLNRLIPHL
jgi:hypothetical protein